MKKIFFLILISTAVSSCNCKKPAIDKVQKTTTTVLNDCPANAKCIQEVHTDSALSVVKQDTGKPYYSIKPQVGTTVYRYELSENKDEQYMDGGYREEIIFELPSDLKNSVISGKAILQTKALFGVFCYCKGKAGYYFINEGTITKSNEGIRIEIPSIVEGQKVFSVQF
jgi:hypothetical protein